MMTMMIMLIERLMFDEFANSIYGLTFRRLSYKINEVSVDVIFLMLLEVINVFWVKFSARVVERSIGGDKSK